MEIRIIKSKLEPVTKRQTWENRQLIDAFIFHSIKVEDVIPVVNIRTTRNYLNFTVFVILKFNGAFQTCI